MKGLLQNVSVKDAVGKKKCGETNLIMAYFNLCMWESEKSLQISKRFKVPEFLTYAIAEVPY